ncbi:hypothetical protein [Brachybacterium timonense]|uniref:hypothetical protein n=1 Tax=Brachybacterium timonense TaxID=2050896 RepID=UPI000D0B16AE|nr:hypothetical protein [Brachybacterium timonense]
MTIRPFRVWQALIAAAASAMLLAACGGGADDAAAPPPGEDTAEASDGGSVDSEPGASDGGSVDSEPSASDAGGQEEPNEAATTISFVWPDDSWQIEELDENPCANGFIGPSPFGDGPDYFTCGPTAAGLIACHANGGETLCVRNHADKQAVRFRSPEADGFSAPPPEDGASPVGAVLEDGTTCNLVAHDHMPHAEGRSSWLHCEDGESALLTLEEGSMEYFDTTEQPWKAELGVGTEEPTIVEVSDVIYLATPEDAQVDD